jgi:UDP-N-acetyl-D-glucosamine dehydrogenase
LASPAESSAQSLRGKIDSRTALVGVIGMGYVGLPLALACVEGGFGVLGFDNDQAKLDELAAGRSYLRHIPAHRLLAAAQGQRFRVTADLSRLAEPDVIAICVPTPLTPRREPDLGFVMASAEAIRDALRPGQLVILESTTYPGTTDSLLRETLEQSGWRAGTDFFLAFSPEREDPGCPQLAIGTTPRVVGGVEPTSGELAEAFYRAFVATTIRVASARTAEASKLTENVFRAVNIALVNELKIVYDRLGIDIWEVLDAAESKPFGFMRFDPGPGWGGHCVPIDPFYLTWKARSLGVETRFIELAGEVNLRMPDYVVEKLTAALANRGKVLRGSRILLLGMAYKRNVDDTRESPAFEILARLRERESLVSYHDPFIPVAGRVRRHPELAGMASLELTPDNVAAQDAVVIVTDHDTVDYAMIARTADLVIDTRGVMRKLALIQDGRVVQA